MVIAVFVVEYECTHENRHSISKHMVQYDYMQIISQLSAISKYMNTKQIRENEVKQCDSRSRS